MTDPDRLEKRERAYREFKRDNPGVSFAEFHARSVVERIAGGARTAQLGPNLRSSEDWREAGVRKFEAYRRRFPITEDSRVVDYGCGTFRIGLHFIRLLEPGNYFGLDVSEELLDIGGEMLGEQLLGEKEPVLGVIGEEAVAEAVAFDADFVFSSSVCTHVHPDEAATYFGNLARLAHRPGAHLWFDAAIADRPVRDRGIAWPLQRYIDALDELEFVQTWGGSAKEEDSVRVQVTTLDFKRPG